MKYNQYEWHAYIYSAWAAMIVPILLTTYVTCNACGLLENMNIVLKIISTLIPSALFYAAIGFFIRELFRNTSKMIFQFALFKEDETEMPTTELLLWKNHELSHQLKEAVHEKMENEFGYRMLSEEEESENESEARLNIVDAVGRMRNATRDDKILLQSNYRYGFQRNQLGGLFWAFVAILIFTVFCSVTKFSFIGASLLALFVVVIQGIIAFCFMKIEARNYAKYLIQSFLK